MKTAAISIKIDPEVKQAARKIATELGFSLSDIVNASLKSLVRNKTVSYSLLEPSPMLKKAIREARRDRALAKSIGPFDNVDDFMKSLRS